MTDIRSIRRELGLSQEELGARLGLNQSTISRFETGELPLDERTKLAVDAILMRAQPRDQATTA
jgi:transcriptional regulator with XRE-family HTH domain